MPERNEAREGSLGAQQKILSASIIDVAVTLHPITESSTWLAALFVAESISA